MCSNLGDRYCEIILYIQNLGVLASIGYFVCAFYIIIMDEVEINFAHEIPRCDYSQCEIVHIDSSNLSYAQFFENYMLTNLPCVIKNVSKNWKCSKTWIKNDRINFDYFILEYGELEAPVADCSKVSYNAHCKKNMKIKDYMSYLKKNDREKIFYLKDWHLRREKPDHKFYEVPWMFASDWLNEYANDNQLDDFMFVYIGPKESWTPLHMDVYSSYSWSVNIVGRKKWILFPPGEENKLKDQLGNLPLLYRKEEFSNTKYFEIIQEAGDAIFVPSGWHHQVFNVHDTISINHNFINGCNLQFVWEALTKNLLSVENEIKEFSNTPEYISQCQLILKSVFGMDYEMFMKFIIHIGNKRIQYYGEKVVSFDQFVLGINHSLFDIRVIFKLLCLIKQHPLYKSECTTPDICEKVSEIITEIQQKYT